MTDVKTDIEAAANRWMQAWVKRDQAVLQDSLGADFSLIVSANPGQQFDRKSWLATATSRYTCSAFRYREVQIRTVNEQVAIMSSIADFTSDIDGVPRTGPMFITDVWRKEDDGTWRVCGRYSAHPEPSGSSSGALAALKR